MTRPTGSGNNVPWIEDSATINDPLGNTSLDPRPVIHATLERRTLRVRGALVALLSLFGGFGDTSSIAVSKGVASFVGETVRVGVTGAAGDAPTIGCVAHGGIGRGGRKFQPGMDDMIYGMASRQNVVLT